MNVMVSARRAFGLMTKYKTMIGTTSRNVAIAMLRLVTTHDRRRSLKCLNLSHSCGDKRCERSVSETENGELDCHHFTSEGNGQWLRKSLDKGSVSGGGLSATRSDPTLNISFSRPSSFDGLFDAREEPCNHSRSAARTRGLGDSSIAMSRWSVRASSFHELTLERDLLNMMGGILTNSTFPASHLTLP
jgi:hypothetical protein